MDTTINGLAYRVGKLLYWVDNVVRTDSTEHGGRKLLLSTAWQNVEELATLGKVVRVEMPMAWPRTRSYCIEL
jgi:hypothetical protein